MPQRDYYLPNNFGFEHLFDAPEQQKGLRHGSTILITGHPGSLKTSFSLSLCRELFRQFEPDPFNEPVMYFVSTEMDRERLTQRYESYGWFDENDKVFSRSRVQIITVSQSNMLQPTLGAEELVNDLFIELRRRENQRRDQSRKGDAFVLIDGVTALLKDSRDAGDWRRNLHEILSRLRQEFIGKLGLVFMTADGSVDQDTRLANAEDAVDLVIRLGVEKLAGGRRARTLEITRAIGSRLALGDHAWELVSSGNVRRAIAPFKLNQRIRNDQVGAPEKDGGIYLKGAIETDADIPDPDSKLVSDKWGVAVFYAHPILPAIGTLQQWKAKNKTMSLDRVPTGIPGVDEMLASGQYPDYWARPARQILAEHNITNQSRGLFAGSVTLLLGRSGSGKTNGSIQFLLAEESPKSCLYVNFENRPHRIRNWFPGDEGTKTRIGRIHQLYRRRSDLDIRVLLSELRFIIESNEIHRIVIDGLSDLWSNAQSPDTNQLLEDLLVTIRDIDARKRDRETTLRNPITIMITLELDAEEDQIPLLEKISFAADNVLLFRPVQINGQRRRTIQVIKARGSSPDKCIREVKIRSGSRYPMCVVPGLEIYRNLFSGDPIPISVSMLLVEENQAEQKQNERFLVDMRRQFSYDFELHSFSRTNLTQTLRDIASGVDRIAKADVKLINIDEWWVRDLRNTSMIPHGKSLWETQHPLMRLTPFLVSISGSDVVKQKEKLDFIRCPSDYWVFEIEKSSIPVLKRPSTNGGDGDFGSGPARVRNELVACPSRLDYGMLCLSKEAKADYEEKCKANGAEPGYFSWVQQMPRVWGKVNRRGWFSKSQNKNGTLIGEMQRLVARTGNRKWGFAFDLETEQTAVCLLLELAWAFGASEDFLIADALNNSSDESPSRPSVNVDSHPLTHAFSFLQFLVYEGLMPSAPSLLETRESHFSRHWYSTFQDTTSDSLRENVSDRDFVPVPFMPVGLGYGNDAVQQAVLAATKDLLTRFKRLVLRIRSCVAYRNELVDAAELLKCCGSWQKRVEAAFTKFDNFGEEVKPSDILALISRLDKINDEIRTECHHPVFNTAMRAQDPNQVEMCKVDLVNETDVAGETPVWRYLPAAEWMDRRDIMLIVDWHELRSNLIRAQLSGVTLKDAVDGNIPRRRVTSWGSDITSLTGYTCEGSWLLGISRNTNSPSLGASILAEAMSLQRTKQRTDDGAAIPSRKDFYDFYGRTSVNSLPKDALTWSDFLKCFGSRGRRRERLVCYQLSSSQVFSRLFVMLRQCLDLANALRERSTGQSHDVSTMVDTSREVVRQLFAEIQTIMQDKLQSHHSAEPSAQDESLPRTCLLCLNSACSELASGDN